VGECANSIIMNSLFGFAMLYYTDALGLKHAEAGIAMALAVFWDAITDPVMGHLSDNTRSRFGRRHPTCSGRARHRSDVCVLVVRPIRVQKQHGNAVLVSCRHQPASTNGGHRVLCAGLWRWDSKSGTDYRGKGDHSQGIPFGDEHARKRARPRPRLGHLLLEITRPSAQRPSRTTTSPWACASPCFRSCASWRSSG